MIGIRPIQCPQCCRNALNHRIILTPQHQQNAVTNGFFAVRFEWFSRISGFSFFHIDDDEPAPVLLVEEKYFSLLVLFFFWGDYSPLVSHQNTIFQRISWENKIFFSSEKKDARLTVWMHVFCTVISNILLYYLKAFEINSKMGFSVKIKRNIESFVKKFPSNKWIFIEKCKVLAENA